MALVPTANSGIDRISPYIGGESAAPDHPVLGRPIRLASNEGAFGPSPRAIEAYAALAPELHRYPDGGVTALRQAIGKTHGLDPARIVCGAGSDELISLLVGAFAGPGTNVLHSRHGFLMYAISSHAAGAEPIAVPDRDLAADIDAFIDRVGPATRLVFVANPNNPTGTLLNRAELARLHAGLPGNVLLVIDAAYAEYLEADGQGAAGYSAGADLVAAHENVVMLRTFSKIYGLGALRLGWAYGAAGVVDVLNRVRGPFNVNQPAQAAALAALADRDFVRHSRDHNLACRQRTVDSLARLGFEAFPSAGNFLLVRPRGIHVGDLMAGLRQRGILVRAMAGYGLPDCVRLTIGTVAEMDAVITGMDACLEASHG